LIYLNFLWIELLQYLQNRIYILDQFFPDHIEHPFFDNKKPHDMILFKKVKSSIINAQLQKHKELNHMPHYLESKFLVKKRLACWSLALYIPIGLGRLWFRKHLKRWKVIIKWVFKLRTEMYSTVLATYHSTISTMTYTHRRSGPTC